MYILLKKKCIYKKVTCTKLSIHTLTTSLSEMQKKQIDHG